MMIESNYSVNVVKDKKHFCRIELGNYLEVDVLKKYKEIEKCFRKEDGYSLTLNYIECYGKMICESK